MDLRQRLQVFLGQHQTIGWLLVLMVGGLLLQGLLYIIFGNNASGLYDQIMEMLVLPYQLKGLFPAIWSLATYPFFQFEFQLLHFLVGGLILWTFGRIHQQLLGEDRTRRMVILGIPAIGLFTVIFSAIIGFHSPSDRFQQPEPATTEITQELPTGSTDATELTPEVEEVASSSQKGIAIGQPGLLYSSGMMVIVMMLVISCITLVPDYPIQLFLFGQVKILWVGLVIFVLELMWANFFTPQAISIIIAGLFGFLNVYALKNGVDPTEVIWNFYKGNKNEPKMTVKHGGRRQAGERNRKKVKVDGKGEISQEIIDDILDKISEKGYESLSREEKELLFKASSKQDDES
ncbi:MAG: DUF6576 domain-containing protein [Bacteroidota bacterium]